MRILAVIPARGGSKRLPRKNILPCAGRPLIVHTIMAAKAVHPRLEHIVVSTDDPEIAEVSRDAGAEVPFIRPAALATDAASSVAVVRHALLWIEAAGDWRPDWVLLLQPTSPLRRASDIEAAIDIASGTQCDSVISVVPLEQHHPKVAKRLENGLLVPFFPPAQVVEEPAYANNGAIYLTRTAVIQDQGSFYGALSRPYVMTPERSTDIDTALDLKIASARMASALKQEHQQP